MPDQSAQVTSGEFQELFPHDRTIFGAGVQVVPLVEASAEKGILAFSSIGIGIETNHEHMAFRTPDRVLPPTHGLLLNRDTALELVHKLAGLFPIDELKDFAVLVQSREAC